MARFLSRVNRSTPRLPIDPDLATPKAVGLGRLAPLTDLLLVGAGGALGTLARYACTQAWPDREGHFPVTIFTVNVSGALLIGVVLTLLSRLEKMGAPRLFLSVGILGGWTTMSAFAVRFDQLVAHQHLFLGVLYAGSTLCSGAIATALGISLASRNAGEGRR